MARGGGGGEVDTRPVGRHGQHGGSGGGPETGWRLSVEGGVGVEGGIARHGGEVVRVFALEAFVAGAMARLADDGITAVCDKVV